MLENFAEKKKEKEDGKLEKSKKKKKRTKHLQKTKLKIKKRIERISIRIFKTEHSVYLLALGFRDHNI